MSRIGAVILAAGDDRLGEFQKATVELAGTTVIKREISILREADVSPIVVVAGGDSKGLENHLAHRKVTVLQTKDAENGDMLASIKTGLTYLNGTCQNVVIVPVDIPAFRPETIRQLSEAAKRCPSDLIVPTLNGVPGHPVMIDMDAAARIRDYRGPGGLNAIAASGGITSRLVEVADPGVAIEINQNEDFKAVLAYDEAVRDAVRIHPAINISLGRDKEFFNSELADFLESIEDVGSMNSACQKLGIAYSRAWTMINHAEAQLGFSLIQRSAGGKGGGSSRLTPEAKELLVKYRLYCRKLEEEAERLFHGIFGNG